MREISEIKAFEDEFEFFHMPSVRIIGKATRSGGKLGNLAHMIWNDVLDTRTHDALLALPQVIEDSLFGWMCDHDEQDGTYLYILGAMTPAGTPVPEGYGFISRDVPAALVAKGYYGDELTDTIEQVERLGYRTDWAPFTWNAEMFIGAEDEQADDSNIMPRHWLVPIKKD